MDQRQKREALREAVENGELTIAEAADQWAGSKSSTAIVKEAARLLKEN